MKCDKVEGAYSLKISWNRVALPVVMVDFMCQVGWAMGCPDIWSKSILGISIRVLGDEFNI